MSRYGGEVCVRPLRIEDGSEVARLLEELGYCGGGRSICHRIERWSRDPHGIALGAFVDQELAGCAAIYIVPFFERDGARARLVALVTDAEHRRRGIGRALVGRASDFARARGAVEIEVTSRRTRSDANRFYAALGFADISGRSRRYIGNV